jgi:hypothetical protein
MFKKEPIRMVELLSERWRKTLTRRYESLGEDVVNTSVANLVKAYEEFMSSGCADSHFDAQLSLDDKNSMAQRLGEMLLHERLKHAGFELHSNDEGPDFFAKKDGETVWLELVTPSRGDDSRIDELFDANDPLNPSADDNEELSNRTLLRISVGIRSKLKAFERYIEKGLIKPGEPCVIVVNDALMCPDAFFYGVSHGADNGVGGVSLVEHATLRFGHALWVEDHSPGQYKLTPTFRDRAPNRPEPTIDGSARHPVPVSLFAQPADDNERDFFDRSNIISGVMQLTLREDYGFFMLLRDRAEKEDRLVARLLYPGTFVPNPYAAHPLSDRLKASLMKITNLKPLSIKEATDLTQRHFELLIGKNSSQNT